MAQGLIWMKECFTWRSGGRDGTKGGVVEEEKSGSGRSEAATFSRLMGGMSEAYRDTGFGAAAGFAAVASGLAFGFQKSGSPLIHASSA